MKPSLKVQPGSTLAEQAAADVEASAEAAALLAVVAVASARLLTFALIRLSLKSEFNFYTKKGEGF